VFYFVAISVWHGLIVINSDICFITIVDSQGMPGSRMESFRDLLMMMQPKLEIIT